ncbi:MAG: hypothetical protein QOF84_2052 [Streptomyces sp.]|jgi:hypothetical protein|nr:hypothetical protein [Streptomyces sp.]
MGDFLPFLVFVGCLGVALGFFAWLASHVRRRGVAGAAVRAAMASYDEAFRVTAHESHYEIQAQAERKVPVPSPDDPLGWSRGESGDAGDRRPIRPHSRRPRRDLRRRFARLWRGR